MSTARVSYSDCPTPVFIQQRPKQDFADLWIRKNIESRAEDQGQGGDPYTVWEADEAYMTIQLAEAPTAEEVAASFDDWYARAEAWEPEEPGKTTLDERVGTLEEALNMILDGVKK